MDTGLLVGADSFQAMAGGEAVGARRVLDPAGVGELRSFTSRYGALVRAGGDRAGLLLLGRDLYRFLDGDEGRLARLWDRAPRPVVFEVRVPRSPSAAEAVLLHAPFELLADPEFLAGDALARFGVVRRLGSPTGPPTLDEFRLGLMFMAAAPRGPVELDYEAEEAAILAAVGAAELDLVVEESGDPDQLGARLATADALSALHLSCHGHDAWPSGAGVQPVLLLEDDQGDPRPTPAGDLLVKLGRARPRLVLLSACLTATGPEGRHGAGGGTVAHSYATALVTAGLPAVLGWDGSVVDGAATAFAGVLYDALADRQDLTVAVADARRGLLNAAEPVLQRDWHLARLWLGPAGGGPVVGGGRKRSLVPATAVYKPFLAKDQGRVPVAAPELFVGRRRELQAALRALRPGGDRGGVLIHGMGRLGKSSLAARIANRRPDLALAVVYEHYGALSVLEALAVAVRARPRARDLVEAGKGAVRADPSRLEAVLVDLLSGPGAQAGADGCPVLLVIDDLERILVPGPDGVFRVEPHHAPVLGAVLRAFEPTITDSRVVLTSRFPFHLEGLERSLLAIQLPPLSDTAQHKLEFRQAQAGSKALTGRSAAERGGREELLSRARILARGNPGLQDLLGARLVLAPAVPVDRAAQVLSEMEDWLAGGSLPDEVEVRGFLENLAVGALHDLAGPAGRDLIRGLGLFGVPVPTPVAEAVAAEFGGSVARLRALGLLDPFEDLVDHRAEAVAVNPLAGARLPELTDTDRATVAAVALPALFEAWGGVGGHASRPRRADLELTRLGVLAEHPEVLTTCAADAIAELANGPANAAAALGTDAIAVLDRQGIPVPVHLLRRTADAAFTAGRGHQGDQLLARAVKSLEDRRARGRHIDPVEAAALTLDHGRRLITRGEPDRAQTVLEEAAAYARQAGDDRGVAIARGTIADILYQRGDLDAALRMHQAQLPVYDALDDVRSGAVTWGKIANIHHRRGDLDEALRIRREEELPVYEALGDIRSKAITWGGVADVHYERGDLDEALRIRREEELPVYEALGDVRSRAVTWGQIADIHYQRGDLDEALRIRWEEQLQVYEALGDVRSRAVTWGKIADIHYQRGDLDEALRIRREEQLRVYETLGDVRSRAITWDKIADIHYQRGDLDEALRIHQEQLPVYESLGDVRSRAVTWGQIADIHYQRGDLDEALRIHQEQLPVYNALGDIRSRAITWGKIADVHYGRGDLDDALRIHQEQLPVYDALGDIRSRAVTWGQIADIHYARGDLDDALRIHQEQLPVYDVLGDIRSRAITWGKIADIHVARDDLDEALRIRRDEELPVYDALGDDRSRAITWGQIADIHVARDDLDEALRIRRDEELPVYDALGDDRSRAVTWGKIAHIYYARGDLEQASSLQRDLLEAARGLGDVDGIAAALCNLALIDLARRDPAAAESRLAEAFALLEQLGRPDGLAVVGEIYGGLLIRSGARDTARSVLSRSLAAYRVLGRDADAEGVARLLEVLDAGPDERP